VRQGKITHSFCALKRLVGVRQGKKIPSIKQGKFLAELNYKTNYKRVTCLDSKPRHFLMWNETSKQAHFYALKSTEPLNISTFIDCLLQKHPLKVKTRHRGPKIF